MRFNFVFLDQGGNAISEWVLPSYLHSIKRLSDEIIAIDDGSTDNSVKILEDAGAQVYSSEKLKNFNSLIFSPNNFAIKSSDKGP